MRYSVFTASDWLYPDSALCAEQTVSLDLARGGHDGAQLLFCEGAEAASVSFCWQGQGPKVQLYQLVSVGVNENTADGLMTTTDYESCKAFVTRKAPFRVYDALCPVEEGLLPGRFGLYLSAEAGQDLTPGEYTGSLTVTFRDGSSEQVPVTARVHRAVVPALSEARLGMMNFFDYEHLGEHHGVKRDSPEYWELFRKYVRSQLEMRCTHILLPPGDAVLENGVLTGFDFTRAETAGRIARQEGVPYLCGGHIAVRSSQNEQDYCPCWDASTSALTPNGYAQLQKYFTQWRKVIDKNNWMDCMTQALADEPQVPNENTYRVLSAICRKFLPGVPIIDAVETTNLGGGVDIWVPKQEVYEKWRPQFDALKASGETMWFYACAYPGGPIMNRTMDLPLTVSRALLWMGALYRLDGFLHWGFSYFIGEDIWNSACCPHMGALLPAGDAHVVYPGKSGPWPSLRYEAQKCGAEDYELLMQAAEKDPNGTDALIKTVCSDFSTYTKEGSVLAHAHRELLERLD